MSSKTKRRAGVLLGLCALTIAGVLAAGSLAATGAKNADHQGARSGWPGFSFGGVVHSEAIVLDEAGDAYITQTIDSGTVDSAAAGELTIKEGTKAMPYGTVKLNIPAAATVTRNGSEAALDDFKAGDFVIVSSSSDGTYVGGGDPEGTGWFGTDNWGPRDGHRGSGDGNWHGGGPWGSGYGHWSGGGPWGAGGGGGPWGRFGGS